ncbi:hypothetical protein CMI38_02625 [Candidatus Pacearchaeota archaeon]|jgi:DNA-binding XRE family transcriptional regulator|nr:hypothetical protein [Candidatus Pacearchaeota archaeon]|tara:strand:- start:1116 stop:1526 length:411 start_codon:yes stop_codon:yes gene_type:complete
MEEDFKKELTEAKSKLYETIRNAEKEYLQMFYTQISEIYASRNEKCKKQIMEGLEGIINLCKKSKTTGFDYENARKAREKAGLTQSKLGEELGIPQQTISQYENGIISPLNRVTINKKKYLNWLRDKSPKYSEEIK